MTSGCVAAGGDPAEVGAAGNDPAGWDALRHGGDAYDQAMSCMEASEHAGRIRHFQDAERWYLQAAAAGNPIAWLCLGYVYSYDRCEGAYEPLPGMEPSAAYPRERRAYECFGLAARAGIAEGCYKFGDLLKQGVGCNPDANAAFSWYERAAELGNGDSPVVWGSAALRLADAFENGEGCPQSFTQALRWYRRAVTGLEIAVRDGDWFYERALTHARNGEKRVAQELAG